MPDLSVRNLPSLARRGVLFELRLYRSLFRWATRRPDVPRSGAEPVGYAKAVTPLMWLWIFASGIEIPFVHLLIPWEGVRITLLVVGFWGLVWMVGLLASLNVYPHLVSDDRLRVRHGASVDITLPWSAIAKVTANRRDLPSSVRTLQPRDTERGTDLQVAVSGAVNVNAELHEPMTVSTPKGDMEVSALSFFVDEPREFAARARRLLSPGAPVRRRDG